MTEAVIVAIITGILTLLGTLLTVWAGISKARKEADIRQAVTDTKLEELTREVRYHNDFAHRIPILEEKVRNLENKE